MITIQNIQFLTILQFKTLRKKNEHSEDFEFHTDKATIKLLNNIKIQLNFED